MSDRHDVPQPKYGDTLGYFRVGSLLGEGGMGRVYKADDLRYGREVALKVMRSDVARQPGVREMFLREARAMAAVGHDRVVTIYHSDEQNGVPFLAMELLAGRSLHSYLEETPILPLEAALDIAYQVAEALVAVHAKGLIHRDIKPGNVWLRKVLGRSGIDVKVLDFGLARTVGTATTRALGTPLYMPPEQFRGKGVDHQSDVFALGVCLYKMLTGQLPFNGDTPEQIMCQICDKAEPMPPSPTEVNPAVPADLSDYVMMMIVRDKSGRVQSAGEVMWVLNNYRTRASKKVEEMSRPHNEPLRLDEQSMIAQQQSAELPRRPSGLVWLLIGGPLLFVTVVVASLAYRPRGEVTGTSNTGDTITPSAEAEVRPSPTRQSFIVPNNLPPAKVRPPLLDCTGPSGASATEVKSSQDAWAAYLGLPVEYRVDLGGGVSMVFVLVPPGMFLMGSTEEELDALVKLFPTTEKKYYLDELPQHPVTITRPMYVGKTEVTRSQFGRHTPADAEEGKKPNWPVYDDRHPVVSVSWNGAKGFAGWLGGRSLPAGFGKPRLPTEAEWEYVCRAGTRSRYPNGSDDPESLPEIGNVCDMSGRKAYNSPGAIAGDDWYTYTAPAGLFAANRFGLFDTIGNVSEWCEDGYEKEAYKAHGSSDPYVKKSNNRHVLRGGSWIYGAYTVRPACRDKLDAADRNGNYGCRVLLPQDSN